MGTTTLNRNVNLKVMECGTCGLPFAIPQKMYDSCHDEGGYWYCPLGHSRGWDKGNKKSRVLELQDEVARLESSLKSAREHSETLKRSRAAVAGELTKVKKRVGNGVCPCCNRSFQNLRRHMDNKHPEFKDDQHPLHG